MQGQRQHIQDHLLLPVALKEDDSPLPHSATVVCRDESSSSQGPARVTFPSLVARAAINGDRSSSSSSSSGCHDDSLLDWIGGSFPDVPPISSLGRSDSENDEAKDARMLQESLVKAFPESLCQIAIDEAAVEAVMSNNTAGMADTGYHRQFTEMVLREVYSLLRLTASVFEVRRTYLMQHHAVDPEGRGFKTYETLVEEESARNLSEWNDAWYHGSISANRALAAVTVRPPQFTAGMLWNGEDRFLLGGTAFVEEGRILQIPMPSNLAASELGDINAPTNGIGGSGSGGEPKAQVRFLLREYISVSKEGTGCMVQSLSLIPEHVSLNVPRGQTLRYDLIQTVLHQCAPGAVTRAFSLRMLLPPAMREESELATVEDPFGSAEMCSHTQMKQTCSELDLTSLPSNENCSMDGLRSMSLTLRKRRSPKSTTAWRPPLGDELYLRFTNPKLYAWAMQHPPAVLTAHTNAIREYFHYSQRLRFRRLMKRLLRAVHIIQHFFRLCLSRKKRAMQRMLHQWRQLELDCRERLKKVTLPPTASDRIGFIVGSVLWHHILTTEEYKIAMLEELFAARRAAYRKWCMQRVDEDQLKEKLSQNYEDIRDNGILGDIGVRAFSLTYTTVAMMTTASPAMHEEQTADTTATTAAVPATSHHKWIAKWGNVVHARFGWYIEPEELLQESHRRMLLSLRGSILTMAEVQAELKKKGEGPLHALN
ncbi:hypothetical protein DQ04_08851020 [Trypanosoma grayi]|uniref:hypothetical protein n=1 Tax=Trypanosoma grayi TaxID=71804 RepID=UPI0004F3F81F|nr:hypothetical protein DQ04_08851020 [Trypanosoma grayi]KEG07779.1 hypothetical protein DQ04_08851020 [Trypanosoma grayi]